MPARRDPAADAAHVEAGRRRARRTALVVGAIALAIYVAFILSGVSGR
ncbi:hypothetical protein [Luteimonas huabeiensis]|nr:hypothetical protein [Luteimonas huabeiensis]